MIIHAWQVEKKFIIYLSYPLIIFMYHLLQYFKRAGDGGFDQVFTIFSFVGVV